MPKKDLKKEVKKFFSSKGTDSFKVDAKPFRDWRTLVIVFFLGLLDSFGFSLYMSIEINQDNFFTTTPRGTDGVAFNRDGLIKVINSFTAKELIFEKITKEGISVVDPSL
jgi:hypothetical protein